MTYNIIKLKKLCDHNYVELYILSGIIHLLLFPYIFFFAPKIYYGLTF